MDDKTVRRLQKTRIGAQYPMHTPESQDYPRRKKSAEFPDAGESTKSDPVPEEALRRCARCGIESQGWTGHEGAGILVEGKSYCCHSCAENQGCDCVAEAERHTGLNLAQGQTDAAPPKPT